MAPATSKEVTDNFTLFYFGYKLAGLHETTKKTTKIEKKSRKNASGEDSEWIPTNFDAKSEYPWTHTGLHFVPQTFTMFTRDLLHLQTQSFSWPRRVKQKPHFFTGISFFWWNLGSINFFAFIKNFSMVLKGIFEAQQSKPLDILIGADAHT